MYHSGKNKNKIFFDSLIKCLTDMIKSKGSPYILTKANRCRNGRKLQ